MTKITYTITMDSENQRVEKLEVLTLCAQRSENGPLAGKKKWKKAFSGPHIAFSSTYTFTDRNAVGEFSIPKAAAKLLK